MIENTQHVLLRVTDRHLRLRDVISSGQQKNALVNRQQSHRRTSRGLNLDTYVVFGFRLIDLRPSRVLELHSHLEERQATVDKTCTLG